MVLGSPITVQAASKLASLHEELAPNFLSITKFLGNMSKFQEKWLLCWQIYWDSNQINSAKEA